MQNYNVFIKSLPSICPSITDSFFVDFNFPDPPKALFSGNALIKTISAHVPKLKNCNILAPIEQTLLFSIELNNNPQKLISLPALGWESEFHCPITASNQGFAVYCDILNGVPVTLNFDGKGLDSSYEGQNLELYFVMGVSHV